MTTYYVRHDGTQTNKANATGGGAAGSALSLAGFNGETFAAGDEIIFERSGTYTGVIQVAGTGTAGNPIVVRGPGADESQHAVVVVSGQNGISITGDYLHVKNFSITCDSDKCVFIGNASGIGGHTVKVYDCIAVANPGGDGFGTNSTAADVSECEFIRCEARAITGLNNQGFTHHSDQKIILTDCRTTRACEYSMVMIGAECTVNGGEFYARDTVFQFGDACVATINGATAIAEETTQSRLFTVNVDGTNVTFNDCALRQGGQSTRNNSIINNTVAVTINGGTLEYAGTNTSGIEWASSGAAGGVVTFRGVRLTLGRIGARFLRTLASGGAVIVDRCVLDLRNMTSASTINVFEIRNTSNGLQSSFTSNIVLGGSVANQVLVRCPVGMVSNVRFWNNVVRDFNGSNADVILNQLSGATAAISVFNNVFYNCADPINGTTGLTANYNNYSGGAPSEGDAAASTAAPGWIGGTEPATPEGYALRFDSALIRAGGIPVAGQRLTLDYNGRRARVPPDIGPFQRAVGD